MDVRFLIDEHIDHSIATALKRRGFDALTVADANLLGADDEKAILPYALQENRILERETQTFLPWMPTASLMPASSTGTARNET
jgi:predicted nuclease of predicted toxin-antitoxin system